MEQTYKDIMDKLTESVLSECPEASMWLWEFWNKIKEQSEKAS